MTNNEKPIFQTPRFTVIQRTEGDRDYYYVSKQNSAIAVVFDDRGHIALLKVSRINVPGPSWELPGGRIEADETAEDAIVREVTEELGIEIAKYQFAKIGTTLPLPSVTNEITHIFKVRTESDLKDLVGSRHDEHEGIQQVSLFTKDEIITMLQQGAITCSVDGYALFLSLIEEAS